jgi:hypothetical protein
MSQHPNESGVSPFSRFQSALRQVLSAPKAEIDAKLKARLKKKRTTKKK